MSRHRVDWWIETRTPTHTCAILVAPFVLTTGIAKDGGRIWTWAGPYASINGDAVPCGYQTQTEEAMIAHLVATHHISLAEAKETR